MIAADPYPLSPRIRRLKSLLAKLDRGHHFTANPDGGGRAHPRDPRECGVAGAAGEGARFTTPAVARLVSRSRRLRPVAAAARGRVLQSDERLVAPPNVAGP